MIIRHENSVLNYNGEVLDYTNVFSPPPPYVAAFYNFEQLTQLTLDSFSSGNNPTASFYFKIKGVGLSAGSVHVTLPSHFEMKYNGTWQPASFDIPYSGTSLDTGDNIKIRAKQSAPVGIYTEQIVISAPGAADFSINVSVEVTAAKTFSYIASVSAYGGPTDNITTPIDTTGAKIIVASCVYYGLGMVLPGFSDNLGNVYTMLTESIGTGGVAASVLFYCINPITSASTTFKGSLSSGFPSITVNIFGSDGTPVFVAQNKNAAGPTQSILAGAVTPTLSNSVFVTAVNYWIVDSPSINSSFTVTGVVPPTPSTLAGATAYKIQSAPATENPTWSWAGNSGDTSTVIVTFKTI